METVRLRSLHFASVLRSIWKHVLLEPLIIQKLVNWFPLQINRLVSIWYSFYWKVLLKSFSEQTLVAIKPCEHATQTEFTLDIRMASWCHMNFYCRFSWGNVFTRKWPQDIWRLRNVFLKLPSVTWKQSSQHASNIVKNITYLHP